MLTSRPTWRLQVGSVSTCTFVPVKKVLSAWRAHDANSVAVRRVAVALFFSLIVGSSHLDGSDGGRHSRRQRRG